MPERAAPVRVLWVVKGLGPGGAERLLVAAARAHDRGAVSPEAAYLLRHKDHLAGDLDQAGVPVHRLSERGVADPAWPRRLRHLVRRGGFDVVHTHSPLLASTTRLLVRTLPRAVRPALVSTEHNLWGSHATATRAVNAATWMLDDVHLAVSDQVRGSVWPRRRQERVEVLIHGIDLDAVRAAAIERQAARAELGVGDDEILLATVANLRATKAYPDLLRAARLLVDRAVPYRLVAVGQGPLEHELRALHAELGLGDRVTFTGYRADVERVLAACDVFVLASRHEGLPVALMEALAAGRPVVATAVGGVPDVVGHGVEGLLVPAGRPPLLADALALVASDNGLRARLGAAAAERAAQFDIRRTVARLEAIYRAVAERSAASGRGGRSPG